MKVSTDVLCIFPVIQQVIGAATLISNTIKLVYDVATAYFTGEWKGDVALYEERDGVIGTPQEIEINRRIRALPGYQFEEHTAYMIIGIIRAIPILGTLWSISCHKNLVRVNFCLDDPRNPGHPIRE